MARQEKLRIGDFGDTYKISAGNFSVRAEWATILEAIDRTNQKTDAPLIRAYYADPVIDHSLNVRRKVVDEDDNYQYFGHEYKGSITLGDGLTMPSAREFFGEYTKQLDKHGLVATKIAFNNCYLVDNATRGVTMVNRYDEKVTLSNASHYSGLGSFKGLRIGMDTPKIRDIKEDKDGNYGYFRDTVLANMLAVSALARILTGREPEAVSLLLSDAKTYVYDSDTTIATRLTERVVLTNTPMRAGKPNDLAQVTNTGSEERSLSPLAQEQQTVGETLDDIGGLEAIREKLKEVILSYRQPAVMERWGAKRPQGILLYGPPGTGKTMLANALAHEIGGKLWEIKVTEITDKWLGNSEKNMQAIFDEAKRITEPTVMFWDEIDSILPDADDGSASATRQAIQGIFKREVASLGDHSPNIIIVAATNHPDRMDEAITRAGRFDLKLYVPLPDEQTRMKIFANKIARVAISTHEDQPIYAVDLDLGVLARATNGWSGADITECLRRLAFKKAMDEARTNQPGTPITQQEILQAVHTFVAP